MANKFNEIAKTLENGGTIIYPTETCYGIGADAANKKAIDKIYKMKKRGKNIPLIILVSSEKMAEKYICLNKTARILMKEFMPGPLTLICKSQHDSTISATVAFRISSHPFVKNLFRHWKKPLVSTSANLSGKPELYSINDIDKRILSTVDIAIDYGQLRKTRPSTIFNTMSMKIVRKGPVSEKEIRRALKNKIRKVLAGGCFNHLHKGHEYFLNQSKKLGDHLTVVISNDSRNRRKYGKQAVSALKRKQEIERLGIADNIIIGHSRNILTILEKEHPDIIALGYDQPELPKHLSKKYRIVRIGKYFSKKYLKE